MCSNPLCCNSYEFRIKTNFPSVIQKLEYLLLHPKEGSICATGVTEALTLFGNKREHLTHWGRVPHICVGNLTIIGSYNGLAPTWCQAIIWTNAGTNCNIFIQENATDSVVCKMVAILSVSMWSLGMDKYFNLTLFNGSYYLSMPGLELIHAGKRGLWKVTTITKFFWHINSTFKTYVCGWWHLFWCL